MKGKKKEVEHVARAHLYFKTPPQAENTAGLTQPGWYSELCCQDHRAGAGCKKRRGQSGK